MTYREQATALPFATLWRQHSGPAPKPTLILPDGCLDLIWDGQRLFVAGPDTRAQRHHSPPNTEYVGLRFAAGLGPALLGVPADELRDQQIALADLGSPEAARILTEQVADDPVAGLTNWLTGQPRPDPLGPRMMTMASAGWSVEAMADRVGLSARQLHRRCLPLFGYGPRHLARVLRLNRALEQVREQRPLAQVAAEAGYCDQAHLSREVRDLVGTTPTRWLAGR